MDNVGDADITDICIPQKGLRNAEDVLRDARYVWNSRRKWSVVCFGGHSRLVRFLSKEVVVVVVKETTKTKTKQTTKNKSRHLLPSDKQSVVLRTSQVRHVTVLIVVGFMWCRVVRWLVICLCVGFLLAVVCCELFLATLSVNGVCRFECQYIIWIYQQSWNGKLATVTITKADVSFL